MQQQAFEVLISTIEGLIQEGEIDRAIELMLELDQQADGSFKQDILTISGNYRQVAREYTVRQVISYDQYNLQTARTRVGLLEILKQLPQRARLNAQIKGIDLAKVQLPDAPHLEKVIGSQNNLLKINWLEKALVASKSVCRVVNGNNLGTGFVVQGGYLFTNHHVLPTQGEAGNAYVEFNYQADINGQIQQRISYRLDASSYIASPPQEYDFVRIKIVDNPSTPLSQRGFLELDPTAIPIKGAPATIIQHPKGEDMQIALTANEVLSVWKQHLYYVTDTEPGSSGSPVFNRDWKVVALHHAGGDMQINEQGERAMANRGILFRDIMAYIAKNGANDISSVSSSGSAGPVKGTESVTSPPPVEPNAGTASHTTPKPAPTVQASANPIPRFVLLYDINDDARISLLNKHLTVLKMTKKIVVHNVHQVKMGEDIDARAAEELEKADYVMVALSSNIFNEDGKWLGMALQSLEAGKRVIPVKLEKLVLEGTGLEKLQSTPSQNRCVSDFPNQEAAYNDIAEGIRRLL